MASFLLVLIIETPSTLGRSLRPFFVAMSALMLKVFLLLIGVGTMPRLERSAWSMVS